MDVNAYFNANWQQLYDALSASVDVAFSLVFREYMEVVLRAVEPLLCEGRDDYDDVLDDVLDGGALQDVPRDDSGSVEYY